MRAAVFWFAVSTATFGCARQMDNRDDLPPRMPSLYVIEENYAHLTRNLVRLSDGPNGTIARETILTREQRFFSHFGGHQMVDGRFVLTPFGSVIDVETKQLINDEQDATFLGVEDGKVVYEIEKDRRETGLFAFDLKTHKVEKIAKVGHWTLRGDKSPDRTMSVSCGGRGEIRLHKLDGSTTKLAEGFYVNYSILSSIISGAPCLWLDNDRILTQRRNGQLVLLHVDGRAEDLPLRMPAPEVISPPCLWFDGEGHVIYSCGAIPGPNIPAENLHLIDVAAKTSSPLTEYALGHGFRVSIARDGEIAAVTHGKRSIGPRTFNRHSAAAAPGVLGVVDSDGLRSRSEVAIWSDRSRKWRSIPMTINEIVGWGN